LSELNTPKELRIQIFTIVGMAKIWEESQSQKTFITSSLNQSCEVIRLNYQY